MKNIIVILVFSLGLNFLSTTESYAQYDSTFSVNTSANPFDEQVIVYINPGSKIITGLKLFDAIGKEVSAFIPVQLVQKGNVFAYTLDFTAVKPGIYFCSIYSDKGIIETRKLFRAAR